jgi:hypothetical protein
MTYKVIDNFLSEADFRLIYDTMMGYGFPWYYHHSVVWKEPEQDNNKNFFFGHPFSIDGKESGYLHILKPLLFKLQVNKVLRIKGNLYPNIGELYQDEMHQDFEFEHLGALYYVNTNNGFTVLHDGTKIESVANRVLIFDSSLPHSSTRCTDQKVRVNINLNYYAPTRN